MPRGRLVRSLPSFLAASLLVVLGLVPACDDPPEVAPEDRQLALGTVTSSLCPSLTVDPPAATTTIIASVFARDGQVAVGVPVTFTTTHGTFDATVVETDKNGQARTQLTVGRPEPLSDTNEITLTATTDNGLSEERKLPVPGTPVLGVSASSTGPAVGNKFEMRVNVGFACNVRRIEGGLSWDNSKVRLDGACNTATPPFVEYDVLNDSDASGNQSGAQVTRCEVGGVAADQDGTRNIRFTYERTAPFEGEVPTYGTSDSGSYLGIKFTAVAEGEAEFDIVEDLVATPAGYGDSFGPPYAVDDDGTDNIAKVTVRAPASSLSAPRRGRY